MKKHTREARRTRLRALHEQGLDDPSIARMMSISKQRVHQLRTVLGLPSSTVAFRELVAKRRKKLEPLIRAGDPPHVILQKVQELNSDKLYRDAKALGLHETLHQSYLDAVAAGYQPKRKATAA